MHRVCGLCGVKNIVWNLRPSPQPLWPIKIEDRKNRCVAKGLRDRNSRTCTLSQNGYGAGHDTATHDSAVMSLLRLPRLLCCLSLEPCVGCSCWSCPPGVGFSDLSCPPSVDPSDSSCIPCVDASVLSFPQDVSLFMMFPFNLLLVFQMVPANLVLVFLMLLLSTCC